MLRFRKQLIQHNALDLILVLENTMCIGYPHFHVIIVIHLQDVQVT